MDAFTWRSYSNNTPLEHFTLTSSDSISTKLILITNHFNTYLQTNTKRREDSWRLALGAFARDIGVIARDEPQPIAPREQ